MFQPSRFGPFVGIDDFDWVVSAAALVSVVAFCCCGCHLMIFDVICPCFTPLPLSDLRVIAWCEWLVLFARKQFSNIHTFSVFGKLWVIISANLLGFALIRWFVFLASPA